eukprot:TRINITY_DN2781_c0_g1_i6.p1 TRINITY_DN2781_c0_g1~~TRINITY_DN2781_c0_g1_i6.p1  ORF type:complete len:141 (-),score=26.63 TRINITY_DN2781_c0_g1_i6:52-474(-)
MRTSILGVPMFHDINVIVKHTTDLAKVTHADDRCIASSIAVTVGIALILQGSYDLESVSGIEKLCADVYDVAAKNIRDVSKEELKHTITKATLYDLHLDEGEKIGYTFKTLGSGFWALRATSDFKKALTAITMEAGDADT